MPAGALRRSASSASGGTRTACPRRIVLEKSQRGAWPSYPIFVETATCCCDVAPQAYVLLLNFTAAMVTPAGSVMTTPHRLPWSSRQAPPLSRISPRPPPPPTRSGRKGTGWPDGVSVTRSASWRAGGRATRNERVTEVPATVAVMRALAVGLHSGLVGVPRVHGPTEMTRSRGRPTPAAVTCTVTRTLPWVARVETSKRVAWIWSVEPRIAMVRGKVGGTPTPGAAAGTASSAIAGASTMAVRRSGDMYRRYLRRCRTPSGRAPRRAP